MTPDPAGLAAVNPANPQTWNAYAYVANQPLTATDPLGLNWNYQNNTACAPLPGTQVFQGVPYACANGGSEGEVQSVGVTATPLPGPPSWIPANLTGVPYCAANPLACVGPTTHPTGPGGGGGGGNGSGVIAAAMAVPQGPSCSKWQRVAGSTSSIAEAASHTAGLFAFGTGIGAAISVAGEAPSGGADTPLTVGLATATGILSEVSNVAGAAAAVLKSYANGSYQTMGTYDWTHLVAFAAEIAASDIPGVSKYGGVLGQVADQGLNIAVSSPLVCQ